MSYIHKQREHTQYWLKILQYKGTIHLNEFLSGHLMKYDIMRYIYLTCFFLNCKFRFTERKHVLMSALPLDRLYFTVLRAVVDATVKRSWRWSFTIWMSCREVVTRLLGSRLRSSTLSVWCVRISHWDSEYWNVTYWKAEQPVWWKCRHESFRRLVRILQCSSSPYFFKKKDNPKGIHFYRIRARGTR